MSIFNRIALSIFCLAMLILSGPVASAPASQLASDQSVPIVSYPNKIDQKCRDGKAKTYDECSDQFAIYREAQARANREGKTLIIVYGAEWCIWSHVFEKHIKGQHGVFTHTYSDYGDQQRYTVSMDEKSGVDVRSDAQILARYVAENFVIAHIEFQYSKGADRVLKKSGAKKNFTGGVPFIYAVKKNGRFSKKLVPDEVEVRRDTDDWYRGYDRKKLLRALMAMRNSASN